MFAFEFDNHAPSSTLYASSSFRLVFRFQKKWGGILFENVVLNFGVSFYTLSSEVPASLEAYGLRAGSTSEETKKRTCSGARPTKVEGSNNSVS